MPNLKSEGLLLCRTQSIIFYLNFMWFGRCLEIGTALTQKCGEDYRIVDMNTASVSVYSIMKNHLISKDR